VLQGLANGRQAVREFSGVLPAIPSGIGEASAEGISALRIYFPMNLLIEQLTR
jgi:hypothetical protein